MNVPSDAFGRGISQCTNPLTARMSSRVAAGKSLSSGHSNRCGRDTWYCGGGSAAGDPSGLGGGLGNRFCRRNSKSTGTRADTSSALLVLLTTRVSRKNRQERGEPDAPRRVSKKVVAWPSANGLNIGR